MSVKQCSKQLLAFKKEIHAMTQEKFGLWLCKDEMDWLESKTSTPKDKEMENNLKQYIKRTDAVALEELDGVDVDSDDCLEEEDDKEAD